MMKIKCLIVDDEPLAQDVLKHHILKFDFLQLEGVCSNVLELISFLNRQTVDLIFLDIKMPEITGTEFVRMFNNPPAIIYTTAYDQYALEAFNQNAIDYLLKPISLERFSKSVQKTRQYLMKSNSPTVEASQNPEESFFVKSEKKLVKISPTEVIYIEGMRNYLCLYTEKEKIVIHSTLNAIEEYLENLSYISRIHKSFFINLNKIDYLQNDTVLLNNKKCIPIGLSYRNSFYEKLKILEVKK